MVRVVVGAEEGDGLMEIELALDEAMADLARIVVDLDGSHGTAAGERHVVAAAAASGTRGAQVDVGGVGWHAQGLGDLMQAVARLPPEALLEHQHVRLHAPQHVEDGLEPVLAPEEHIERHHLHGHERLPASTR
jgi:hypothetical protein